MFKVLIKELINDFHGKLDDKTKNDYKGKRKEQGL